MAADKIAESETHSLKTLYREFGESTSMHGINRVLTTTSTWKRSVWSVVFLFGVGFAAYQFVTTMTDFYSYPVTTVVTLKHETYAQFPGITICNLNRKIKSAIGLELLEQISGFEEFEVAPTDTELNVVMQTDAFNSGDTSGHQISKMLLKCILNRKSCSKDNFTPTDTASYGTCHTFEITDPRLQFTTRPGPDNGLILELNIQQYEYLPISAKAGVKVIVHPVDEYPCPEDGGILAQPGAVTSIGIKKVVTRRLPSPYSNCVGADGRGSTQRIVFSDQRYTQKACMNSCYQLSLYEQCECCDVDLYCDYYKMLNIDEPKVKTDLYLPRCNTSEDLYCKSDVEDQFRNSELDCDERCPPACDRTTFDTVVSQAQWPSDARFDDFVNTLKGSELLNTPSMDKPSLERFVRSNYLRLAIFLDSMDFQEFVTQPKYDWNLLLGTIGGLLGLWLGFSLLTGLEIVEVLIDTVVYCTRKRYQNKMNIQTE